MIPAVVPSGCTPLIQPLDTAINGAFKSLLKEEIERLTDKLEDDVSEVEN